MGISAAPVLCNGPEAEVSEELCEGGGLVVGVEAAGVGEDPGVAAAEGGLLEADAGVFDAGDDAVGTDADEGDDGGAPAFDFGLEALAAGAKFVVGEFIGAGGSALDDVGDAEFEVEKEGFFKGGEEARREAAAMEGGPEAVAGAAEVAADGGGVEAGVDAGEEDDEVFGGEIRDELVVRGEELGFGGFPGGEQCPIHRAASLEGILSSPRGRCRLTAGRDVGRATSRTASPRRQVIGPPKSTPRLTRHCTSRTGLERATTCGALKSCHPCLPPHPPPATRRCGAYRGGTLTMQRPRTGSSSGCTIATRRPATPTKHKGRVGGARDRSRAR